MYKLPTQNNLPHRKLPIRAAKKLCRDSWKRFWGPKIRLSPRWVVEWPNSTIYGLRPGAFAGGKLRHSPPVPGFSFFFCGYERKSPLWCSYPHKERKQTSQPAVPVGRSSPRRRRALIAGVAGAKPMPCRLVSVLEEYPQGRAAYSNIASQVQSKRKGRGITLRLFVTW